MKTILDNTDRVGRFTSSQVYKLIPMGKRKMTKDELALYKEHNPKSRVTTIESGFSKLGLTYIKEKLIERRLDKSLDTEAYSQSASWGDFMELVIYNLLGLEYKIESQKTTLHYDRELSKLWCGSADLIVPNVKIAEIKCYQLKKFSLYADCLMKQDVKLLKEEFSSEYWQIISNACINNVDKGEAILYVPYESEMESIKEMATEYDGEDRWKYRFIYEQPLSKLACLKDNGYYSNIVKFEFDIPKEDKDFLLSRIKEAGELLNE